MTNWQKESKALIKQIHNNKSKTIFIVANSHYKLGKLLIEVTVDIPDDVLHPSQLILNDEESPLPIPPKGFKEDSEESQYYDDVIKYARMPNNNS